MAFLANQHVMGGDGGMGPLTPVHGMMHDAMALTPVNGSQQSMGTMVSPSPTPGSGGRSAEERQLSQWGYHETKEFISIRGEMEKDFVQTRGDSSKTMWEMIAQKMKERGYRRTAAQCKCKWKVLVNRYKAFIPHLTSPQGKELGEGDDKMAPPFFEELDAIFKERAKNMDRLLLESTVTPGAGDSSGLPAKFKAKPLKHKRDSDDDYSAGEDHEDGEDPEDMDPLPTKRRKVTKKESKSAASVQEVLEQFFIQQLKLEQEWRDAVEKRETERRLREREWRDRMESIERERLAREQEWRKKEDERRAREEARAERRDKLIAALLAKLG